MTKAEMIDYIEKSNVIINFSRSYLNHRLKEDVERFYKMAVEHNSKKGGKKNEQNNLCKIKIYGILLFCI